MNETTSTDRPTNVASATLAVAPRSASNAAPTVTVEITFPASWMTNIYATAEDALYGRDLFWMKQLMAKIAIAAARKPIAGEQPQLPSPNK